jgi:hypothetical protein
LFREIVPRLRTGRPAIGEQLGTACPAEAVLNLQKTSNFGQSSSGTSFDETEV